MKDIVEVLREEFDKFSSARYYRQLTNSEEEAYRMFVHRFAAENNIKIVGRLIDGLYWCSDGWEGFTTEDELVFALKYL